jgi:hypothetical protein
MILTKTLQLAQSIRRRIPTPITQKWLETQYIKGMIRKKDLKDGCQYLGSCRNSYAATWCAKDQKFYYIRSKFGSCFAETICHPEDDNGFDLFVPVRKITYM